MIAAGAEVRAYMGQGKPSSSIPCRLVGVRIFGDAENSTLHGCNGIGREC